jgi:hypothetical protein
MLCLKKDCFANDNDDDEEKIFTFYNAARGYGYQMYSEAHLWFDVGQP